MIDPKKLYRTRDGREVRIYAVDGAEDMCIHGAMLTSDGWEAEVWNKRGVWLPCNESPHDLIEVRPRIQREVWVNVYRDIVEVFNTKHYADIHSTNNRIACVKLVIDCEEGHGLD